MKKLFALVSSMIAVAAARGDARACDVEIPDPARILPAIDGTAPPNAELIALGTNAVSPELHLYTAAGDEVPLETSCEGQTEKSGLGALCVGRPTEPLAPGSYTWSTGGKHEEASFLVEGASDEEASPSTPWSVRAEAVTVESSCDDTNDVIRFSFSVDALPDAATVIVKPAGEDAIYGASTDSLFVTEIFEAWLGENADAGCLDARLIDGAGNVTELGQVCYETFRGPAEPKRSCAMPAAPVAHTSAGGLALAALFGASWLARRRFGVRPGETVRRPAEGVEGSCSAPMARSSLRGAGLALGALFAASLVVRRRPSVSRRT